MAHKKLTQLTEITSLPDDALIYVVSGGTSYKITKVNLLAGIAGGQTIQEILANGSLVVDLTPITYEQRTDVDDPGTATDRTTYGLDISMKNLATKKAVILSQSGIQFTNEDVSEDTMDFLIEGLDQTAAGGKIQIPDLAGATKTIKFVEDGGDYTDATFGTFANSLTEATIADADSLNFSDASDSNKQKKITWSNIKSTLKTYFDTLYASIPDVTTAISEALTTANTYTDNALEDYSTTSQMNTALALKSDKDLFLFQQSDRTLTSNTSAQDIFDVGITGSEGVLTLEANTTYHFEMELSMTGLSSTNGTISISFDAGTVGVGIFKANSVAKKAGFGNASTPQFVFFDTTSVLPVVATSTVTTANVFINGVIVTSTAGTFKPRVTMSQASASTVQKGTYLIVKKIGSDADTHYPTS